MHRVLFVLTALAVVSCAAGESHAAIFRRSCSSGGSCSVGSSCNVSSCNVSSGQSCNISGSAAPASVIVQPQSPPTPRIPASQFPTPQFPTQEFSAPPPFVIQPQQASFGGARALQYDLSSAAQFCAAPVARPAVETPASGPAWPPAIHAEPTDQSLAMLRAFR